MKTEEQLLLTYMYQEGYTEEDIYDERVVQKVLCYWHLRNVVFGN